MLQFSKLFEPGRIGNLELKNRIIFPPMVTHLVTKEGKVSNRLIDYYAERARGGAAMVIVEAAYPSRGGHPGRMTLASDNVIPGLAKLVDAIHKEGAKVALEVNVHRGSRDEADSASPSGIPPSYTSLKPRALSVADIKRLVGEFGEGVRRIKEAGFDAVVIHGANGYLVDEFLSPLTNKRTDQYGGDLMGRARFALELVDVTRKQVGPDYPVMFRLMGDERIEGGFTTGDAAILCKMLEESGANEIGVCSGGPSTYYWVTPCIYMPPACNVDVSETIKKAVKIPVDVAGRINDPNLAEKILREEKADFVCIGRGLIADPEFPRKAMEGKVQDICPCITCNRCQASVVNHVPVSCSVYPAAGNEREFEAKLKLAERKKRILVIGGGPAGMQAAIISAQKGHDVTLWEESDKLGGQLNLACVLPSKSDIGKFLEYLKIQVNKLKVTVELKKEATVSAIEQYAPDAVVVATGSVPFIVTIPGIRGRNVVGVREFLSGERETGKTVAVWGAGLVGCETAYLLAAKGKKVIQIFPEAEPAPDAHVGEDRKVLLKKLEENKVALEVGVKEFEEITPKGIRFINKEGNEVLLEVDSIVLATGARPNNTLAKSLRGKVPELYEAGDCVEARLLLEAIHEGARAGLEI